MTPQIIPVTSQQEALRLAMPGAMKIYQDETPEGACSLFCARVGGLPAVVFTWTQSREVVKAGRLVTISADMVGIPYAREMFESADKLPLDTPA